MLGVYLVVIVMVPWAAATGRTDETSSERLADAGSNGISVATPGAAMNTDEILLLEVHVNGHFIGKIGEFTMHQGKLMARPDELRALGFRVLDSSVAGPNGLIALSDLPGVTWKIDQQNQVLLITVEESRLLPTLLQPTGSISPEAHRVIESGTGATLNYDTIGTLAAGHAGVNGILDMRTFSSFGIVSSGWLASVGSNAGPSPGYSAIRLDSAYSFADVNSLRRYSVGDFITSGLSWTRPVRLEGLQIRSDFSTRPDLVTFPLPSVVGSAAVPSTVQVLADGNMVASSQVAPGPFQIPQLPVVSGAGTISMTVTNALGQQVTVTQPFYASSTLLAPRLQTFSVQAGLVRRNWGFASFDYGKIAGTALYRRGLNPKFTIETSVEGAPGVFLAGAGGVAQIGHFGVFNFAASTSTGSGRPGAQLSAGAQRIGRVLSLGASVIIANRNYRDVASMNGASMPWRQISGFTSFSLKRFGSIGAAYAGVDQVAGPVVIQSGSTTPERSQVVSCNYSVQIHHISFIASEYRSFAGTSNSNGLQVGLTFSLGPRRSAQVSGASDGTAQVAVQQSATRIGEWGYQAYVSGGDYHHEFAQVQYKSPVSLLTAGVDSNAGQSTLRMESQGALSLVDGSLFASNTIYDSFGIVDTGMPRVHVLQENRDVGSTDSSGRLLVPDMRSFDLNHIAIEATDIPADITINDPSRAIRPQDRSGVVIKFPIKFSHGALLRLVDEAGLPLPLGSSATLRSNGAIVPVGYDGEAYVEDLASLNELTVERPDGRRCKASFEYRAVAGNIPLIGPLHCVEQKP